METRLLTGHAQVQVGGAPIELGELESELKRLLPRGLHDRAAQTLMSMLVGLEAFKTEQAGRQSVLREIESLQGSTREVLNHLREVLHELREDVEFLDCAELISGIARQFEQVTRVPTQVAIGEDCRVWLPASAATSLGGIVEEALTNVWRQGGARAVLISLGRDADDSLVLNVKDDRPGRGLRRPPESMGLIGMRSRVQTLGGGLEVLGNGDGIEVRMIFPVPVGEVLNPDHDAPIRGGDAKPKDDEAPRVRLTRVVIADDQPLFRIALGQLLQREEHIQVVGIARDGEEAVAMTEASRPDVLLMDLRMPKMDGLEATRIVTTRWPGTRVLILTTSAADQEVVAALKAGASGFILKDAEPESLINSIRSVVGGEQVMARSISDRVVEILSNGGVPAPSYDGLTPREIEILRLMASGKANKQIASQLKISGKTVRNHVSNMYEKLGLNDRTLAVRYAVRKGLIEA